MRKPAIIVALVFATVSLLALPALAAEYYVVKGPGGTLGIADTKPGDPAEVVSGPYSDKETATTALNEARKAEMKMPPPARETGTYYVVKNEQGEYGLYDSKPPEGLEVVAGPFSDKQKAMKIFKEKEEAYGSKTKQDKGQEK
jgi:hypothetical protein